VTARFGLDPLDQVSFVVADMDASLPRYEGIFGKFRVQKGAFLPDRVTYRGEPCEASLVLGFGRSGNIQIELIQVTSGDAPQVEHLRRFGEGLHHVRFPTPDHDRQRALLEAAGFTTVLNGSTPSGIKYSYLECPADLGYSLFEIVEGQPIVF
jgi:catechol 2,3-dioxygenase-like lactoylglutathione lyase family enzyme